MIEGRISAFMIHDWWAIIHYNDFIVYVMDLVCISYRPINYFSGSFCTKRNTQVTENDDRCNLKVVAA